ncbi:TauD/TfdA family dioxygenase [Croceitalea marina]|uniref:TauD/TfdA family dioxygenase n=1 Tax=Croceitalea marina TaxID=1775166 RepID=A0ABW5MSF6_9FLAO
MKWDNQKGLPYTIQCQFMANDKGFGAWYLDNQAMIEEKLKLNGAVLFKQCGISTINDFNQVLDLVTKNLKPYIDGFSPRSKLQSNIYTSTEYDKSQYITLHNELSYSSNWPNKLFFCCIVPSATGGETAISDCREVLHSIPESIVAEFREKGVRYIRNIHSGKGGGPSWQETFETHDKKEVEAFCDANDIEYEWRDSEMLRLTQNRSSIIKHPVTKEEVWFNQVDQFHPSHLPNEIYETLMMLNKNVPEDLPMYGCFGDGSEIPQEYLTEIRNIADSKRVTNKWDTGDILMVDNILTSHGRMPYTGERQILVAME